MRKLFIKICFLSIMLFCPKAALAANAADLTLPELLHGQATVVIDADEDGVANESDSLDIKSYGTASGNFAVFNSRDGESLGFDKAKLTGAGCNSSQFSTLFCFVLQTGFESQLNYNKSTVKLLESRTVINRGADAVVALQTPTLFYNFGLGMIEGDAWSKGKMLSDFSFWGRTLAQTNDSTLGIDTTKGALWATSGYTQNTNSQSYWDGTGTNPAAAEYNQFDAKDSILADESKILATPLSTTHWCLNNDGSAIKPFNTAEGNTSFTDCDEIPSKPEGNVWTIDGTLEIPDNTIILYKGIGTLVIKGNLIMGKGAKLMPYSNDSVKNRLGIIVEDR